MANRLFTGVWPAITTPFGADGEVDHAALAAHAAYLRSSGCAGIVALGSLGEGAVLRGEEKLAILHTLVASDGGRGRAQIVAGIAAAATRDAVTLAQAAATVGCCGLMVLPPYVHKGELREAEAHVAAVLGAVELPCMLYNNPVAYGTDFVPERIAALAAAHGNLVAVKESSGDARRVTAIAAACGDRLTVVVGLDDMVVEGVAQGATGWVAGLANALPRESVVLFERAQRDGSAAVTALYRWFLPLLRLDTVPEFVQWIKLVQQEVGRGHERVRPPRLPLGGEVRARGLAAIRRALAARSEVDR